MNANKNDYYHDQHEPYKCAHRNPRGDGIFLPRPTKPMECSHAADRPEPWNVTVTQKPNVHTQPRGSQKYQNAHDLRVCACERQTKCKLCCDVVFFGGGGYQTRPNEGADCGTCAGGGSPGREE